MLCFLFLRKVMLRVHQCGEKDGRAHLSVMDFLLRIVLEEVRLFIESDR